MVLVNTVVLVRADLGGGDLAVAVALGSFGAGSMAAALLLPRLLDRVDDRTVMTRSGAALVGLLFIGAELFWIADGTARWIVLLALWATLGVAYSAVLTPVGRLIRRSGSSRDLPALFAAQYALSHGEWLVLYLLAGFLGTALPPATALALLAVVALGGLLYGLRSWPAEADDHIDHVHDDLDDAHPHLTDARPAGGGWRHRHHYVIDRNHPRWPTARRPKSGHARNPRQKEHDHSRG